MRRSAFRSAFPGLSLLAATLLAGCSGAGTFYGDTLTFPGSNPNLPINGSENGRRAQGQPVGVNALLPEPGDIWPGPPPEVPTLSDIEKLDNQNPANPPGQFAPDLPDHQQPRRGQVPLSNQPNLPPIYPAPVRPPAPGTTVQTPRGQATITGGTNAYRTTTPPGGVGGGQGILIPNGNGTSTLIGPNGSVTTIPTPK